MALYRFLFAPVLLAVAVIWSPADHDGAPERARAAAPPPAVERASAAPQEKLAAERVEPTPAALR